MKETKKYEPSPASQRHSYAADKANSSDEEIASPAIQNIKRARLAKTKEEAAMRSSSVIKTTK